MSCLRCCPPRCSRQPACPRDSARVPAAARCGMSAWLAQSLFTSAVQRMGHSDYSDIAVGGNEHTSHDRRRRVPQLPATGRAASHVDAHGSLDRISRSSVGTVVRAAWQSPTDLDVWMRRHGGSRQWQCLALCRRRGAAPGAVTTHSLTGPRAVSDTGRRGSEQHSLAAGPGPAGPQGLGRLCPRRGLA